MNPAIPFVSRNVAKQSATSPWSLLYQIAGGAALLSTLLIPVQIVVFLVWPPPIGGTAVDWFALFQANPVVGLIDLDLILVADVLLLIPITLALYSCLHSYNESLMLLATAFGFVSIAMYIATNPSVEMFLLSRRYASSATGAEQSVLLAAGETLLAGWQGTAFHIAYLVGSLAGIGFGAIMLHSAVFGKLTGAMGLLGNLIGLGLYVPVVGLYISVFSVLFLELWYLLIGLRFLALAKRA
jgi:hypothetical protein